MIDNCLGSPKITVRVLGNILIVRYSSCPEFSMKKLPYLLWHHSRLNTIELVMHRVGRQLSAGFHSLWLINLPWCLTNALLDTGNLLCSAELSFRQSANSCTTKHSNPGSIHSHTQRVHGHLVRSPWIPDEEFADSSWSVCESVDSWWGDRRHFMKSLRNHQEGSADKVSRIWATSVLGIVGTLPLYNYD